jgi:hypothetical protein
MSRYFGLSKSRLIEWRQCPKRLWLKVHRPELTETSAETERAFQVGYAVGEVAQQLHPDGILIDAEDLREALRLTQEALSGRPGVPLFEATFQRDGVLVRADLLLPEDRGYRMVEVKAATSVKDYYLADVAIQRWVTGGAIPLTGVDIAHVDNQFIYPGGGDYRGLLRQESVEAETETLYREVPEWISAARDVLAGSEPDIAPGDQCSDPFDCPFIDHCNSGKTATEFPLYCLPRLSGDKIERLEAQGIIDVREIPEDFPLTENQARVRRITIDGKPELLPDGARELSSLAWPRYYLDFETVSMPVPIWAGTHPYQILPVQWSCHVEHRDGTLEHCAFLAESLDDPRPAFARTMIDAAGRDGPVFVYNQSFELGRIRELARDFPDMADALNTIAARVVDLMPLTQDSYYHPAMMGSWSIKAVLPTIASDLDYSTMAVGDGGEAEETWLEILHPATLEERRKVLRQGLADYCALDTLAMFRLTEYLRTGLEIPRP